MSKKKTTEGLRPAKMGRRNFLKSGGQILPALAVMGLTFAAPMTARADCKDSCAGSCHQGCTGSCKESCTGSCMQGCEGGSK